MRTHGFIGTSAANDAVPDNSPGDADYGWVGAAQKLYEHQGSIATIEMGVRQYVPSLGRFLSVDPVEGGVTNCYDYPPDPINKFDLTGLFTADSAEKWYANDAAYRSVVNRANRGAAKLKPLSYGQRPSSPFAQFSPEPKPIPLSPRPMPSRPPTTTGGQGGTDAGAALTTRLQACAIVCAELGSAFDNTGRPHLILGAGIGLDVGISGKIGGQLGFSQGWDVGGTCSASFFGTGGFVEAAFGSSFSVGGGWSPGLRAGCSAGVAYVF